MRCMAGTPRQMAACVYTCVLLEGVWGAIRNACAATVAMLGVLALVIVGVWVFGEGGGGVGACGSEVALLGVDWGKPI